MTRYGFPLTRYGFGWLCVLAILIGSAIAVATW